MVPTKGFCLSSINNLNANKLLHMIYRVVLIDGIQLETFAKMLSFLFSLQDSARFVFIRLDVRKTEIFTKLPHDL